MSGVRSGVNGTPSFYVNGAKYDGDYGADALVAELERAASG
jgi:protein-disulfide isomerase